jgi:hypothetical protein
MQRNYMDCKMYKQTLMAERSASKTNYSRVFKSTFAIGDDACSWQELQSLLRTISKRALLAGMLYMSSATQMLW